MPGLLIHCNRNRCGCSPILEEATILGRPKTKMTREILEGYFVSRCEDGSCVSVLSIALYEKELMFLRKFNKY